MTHCTIEQLTDHLLGEANEEIRERVTGHLASGCQRCTTLLAMLSRIRRIGRFDSDHRPPDGAARRVKMRLSFDSLRSPGLAGARSMHTSSRHLVFYSQNFALDLRMDYARSVRDVVVVGQLLNRDWVPLSDVPAYLVSDNRVVSHSTTGRLGEFHMECRPRGTMHLQLAVDDDELIDVEFDRRQLGDLRPILIERNDLAVTSGTAHATHSRTSDSDQWPGDPSS